MSSARKRLRDLLETYRKEFDWLHPNDLRLDELIDEVYDEAFKHGQLDARGRFHEMGQ